MGKRIWKVKSLAELLPEFLVDRLAAELFEGSDAQGALWGEGARLKLPPEVSRFAYKEPSASASAEGSRGPLVEQSPGSVLVRRFGAPLAGYELSPLGLPAYHGLYQSSLWEDGGWDVYNTDMVSLSFLFGLRCDPLPGSKASGPLNAFILGHYYFEGSLSELRRGEPLRGEPAALSVAVAWSFERLEELAAEMNVKGYGQRACSQLLEDAPLGAELAYLLNPAYYERLALKEATGAVRALPSPSGRRLRSV